MNAGRIERIEIIVDQTACAMLAAAAGFACFKLLGGSLGQLQLGASCASAAVLAYLLSRRVLDRRFGAPDFALPAFEAVELEPFEPDELVLTDADRVVAQAAAAEEPLVLDDILAEIGPDSRVVRLFDRKAMPTPGHLSSRIDDHLGQRQSPPPAPDASQALFDALAELRRSLR